MKSLIVPLSIGECLDRISNRLDNRKTHHPWVSKKKLKILFRENSGKNYEVRLMGLNLGITLKLTSESQTTTLINYSKSISPIFEFQMVIIFSMLVLFTAIAPLASGKIGFSLLFLGAIVCLGSYMWSFVNSGQEALISLVKDTFKSPS
jgi:hypothetical protein